MERNPAKQEKGPMRLYVGSLHFNINEEMLRGIFEPFGSIQSITLMMDYETGRSKGYGFVTYEKSEDAKKAMEQMNGFELAGRPMKVKFSYIILTKKSINRKRKFDILNFYRLAM